MGGEREEEEREKGKKSWTSLFRSQKIMGVRKKERFLGSVFGRPPLFPSILQGRPHLKNKGGPLLLFLLNQDLCRQHYSSFLSWLPSLFLPPPPPFFNEDFLPLYRRKGEGGKGFFWAALPLSPSPPFFPLPRDASRLEKLTRTRKNWLFFTNIKSKNLYTLIAFLK